MFTFTVMTLTVGSLHNTGCTRSYTAVPCTVNGFRVQFIKKDMSDSQRYFLTLFLISKSERYSYFPRLNRLNSETPIENFQS